MNSLKIKLLKTFVEHQLIGSCPVLSLHMNMPCVECPLRKDEVASLVISSQRGCQLSDFNSWERVAGAKSMLRDELLLLIMEE